MQPQPLGRAQQPALLLTEPCLDKRVAAPPPGAQGSRSRQEHGLSGPLSVRVDTGGVQVARVTAVSALRKPGLLTAVRSGSDPREAPSRVGFPGEPGQCGLLYDKRCLLCLLVSNLLSHQSASFIKIPHINKLIIFLLLRFPRCHLKECSFSGPVHSVSCTYTVSDAPSPELLLSLLGKSSLTIQFVEGQFVDSYDPTIENTFTKLITVNGQDYHLQLVDTAGQDEYSIFPQTYSIDINGYILVYSVTSTKSFEVIKVIHGKLLDMVGKVQIPIMLVGNKKDLHMERVVSYEEGKALAESWNAAFLESSAKENQTAVDVFRRIILEAEKIDGAASQGKSSCSVM
ncbi:PREDICTED: GTP-binding protein Rheb [Condylura cristata]|nr:PREDICTED: GTP-binding protein Rheb [Condylura cristata]